MINNNDGHDSELRWYVAKDIKEILGITPSQLFHWGKTWGIIAPDIKAKGRQGKDKYSFKSLLVLALIQELLNFNMGLKGIKEIIKYMQTFPPIHSFKVVDAEIQI